MKCVLNEYKRYKECEEKAGRGENPIKERGNMGNKEKMREKKGKEEWSGEEGKRERGQESGRK